MLQQTLAFQSNLIGKAPNLQDHHRKHTLKSVHKSVDLACHCPGLLNSGLEKVGDCPRNSNQC